MTPEDLNTIAETERQSRAQKAHSINVCVAAGCVSLHSEQLKDALEREVKARGLDSKCRVRGVGCMGLCAAGPLVSIEPGGAMRKVMTPKDAGVIVDSLSEDPAATAANVENLSETDRAFFSHQMKVVLENSGRIDPERIEEYIANEGYEALLAALTTLAPQEVIDQVSRSGLRGRGGAGFPTGLKWGTVAKAHAPTGQKYVICNADEGDPGAFMDRSVLESDPHRVLEGMAIAARAVGADRGFIYVRAEYPLAAKRLKIAIRQAEKAGLLGANIFNTTFSFTISIRLGAGAFVCGEETALIESIEGKRGQPRPRPPYPAEQGLWGCPTLINNVETFANIPPIIRRGGDWFAGIGTEKSKGTKVFALAGKVLNTGLIEVPMGITLRQIIFDIGGGVPEGGKFKAVQTGGPSGGCIPEQFLDMPVEYDSLMKVGSIMGSGGMIVMDDSAVMVDVARFFMDFCRNESCGKCVPCRVGTAQMLDLLRKILDRKATARDLQLLEELCDMVKQTSLCGLGQSAPNPVLTTLKYFRQEYLDRMRPDESSDGEGQASRQSALQGASS